MTNKLLIPLLVAFLTLPLYSQSKIDSLKYYYSLNITEDERSLLIKNNILTPLQRTNLDSLLFISNHNLLLAKETGSIEAIANAQIGLGTSFFKATSNGSEALKLYFKALKGFEISNNKDKIVACYMGIAIAYKLLEDYENSMMYNTKALRLKEEINKKDKGYYSLLINRANLAIKLKDYEMSFKNVREAKTYFKNDLFFCALIESNTGFYFNELYKEENVNEIISKLHIKTKQDLLDSSLVHYRNSLAKALEIKSDRRISYAYFGLGENNFLKNKYLEAIDFYEKSIFLAKKANNLSLLKRCYNAIYLSYIALDNTVETLNSYKKLTEINNEINSAENKKAAFEQKLIYNHDKELLRIENKKEEQKIILISSLIVLTGIFLMIVLKVRKRNAIKKLKLKEKFTSQIIKLQENERSIIAKELHDSIGQSLLVIKNTLLLRNKKENEEVSMIQKTIEEVRDISFNLHPFQFEKLGLSKSIIKLVNDFQGITSISYVYNVSGIDELIPKEKQFFIFRILQESIVNIEKHSNATNCKLDFTDHEKAVKIILSDDGVGFDIKQQRGKSLGLNNLKERAQYINAIFTIESEVNKGTKTVIEIPKK